MSGSTLNDGPTVQNRNESEMTLAGLTPRRPSAMAIDYQQGARILKLPSIRKTYSYHVRALSEVKTRVRLNVCNQAKVSSLRYLIELDKGPK